MDTLVNTKTKIYRQIITKIIDVQKFVIFYSCCQPYSFESFQINQVLFVLTGNNFTVIVKVCNHFEENIHNDSLKSRFLWSKKSLETTLNLDKKCLWKL